MSSIVNEWVRGMDPRDFMDYLELFGSVSEALVCLYDYILYDLTQRDGYIYTSGLLALWDKERMGAKLTSGFIFITNNKPQFKHLRTNLGVQE